MCSCDRSAKANDNVYDQGDIYHDEHVLVMRMALKGKNLSRPEAHECQERTQYELKEEDSEVLMGEEELDCLVFFGLELLHRLLQFYPAIIILVAQSSLYTLQQAIFPLKRMYLCLSSAFCLSDYSAPYYDIGNNSNNKYKLCTSEIAMQLIALKNFKSYESLLLNNLSPNINVVIGKNGQGKSNFFKAINFVLTDKIAINKSEFNAYTHRALDNEAQAIAVETYFRSQSNMTNGESSLFKIERVWNPDLTEELKIEDKLFKKHEFETYVESIGIAYSNSYHIIQQGKIDQITRMDDFQLFKLLEEATGMRKFEKRYEQAQLYMKKNSLQKEEIKTVLLEIENRIKTYEGLKEEYEYHNYEELAHKVRNKNEFQEEIHKNYLKLEGLKENQSTLSEQIVKLKTRHKEMKAELEQINHEITVNSKQIYEFESNPEDEDLVKRSPLLKQQHQQITAQLKRLTDKKNKMRAQFERKNKETENAKKELEAYKTKYSLLTSQLEGEKLAKSSKGKAEIKQTIDRLQQNIKETDEQIKKMNNYIKEFKIQTGTKELEESNRVKEKLNTLNIELKATKIKMYEQNRIKNQLQFQIDSLSKQSMVYHCKMRKVMPLLETNLLKELRKQKVPGIYGFLIEFVEIDPSVAFAYQMSGLSKLCTLLVENEQACKNVIEANKRIKGKQINILPINIVRRQPFEKKSFPDVQDCYSLVNQQWIKIRPHPHGQDFNEQLAKIINNTFNKYVLVKSYELGLDVSKRYHFNCITADKEIVYSEGYFCKVGKDESVDDRIEVYYKFIEKDSEIARAKDRLDSSSKELLALQNIELDLTKKKVGLENDLAAVDKKLEEINYQKKALDKVQEQVDNLERKRKGFESQLRRMDQMQAAIDSKQLQKVNMKEFKELEEAYNAKLKLYNQKSEEQYEVERKLTGVAREEEQLNEKAAQIRQELEFNSSFRIQYVGEREYKQSLESELQKRQERVKELEREIFQMEEQISSKQFQDYEAIGHISLLTEQIAYYNEKLQEIGNVDLTLEEIQERSNSFSLSFSHLSNNKKAKHYYTARQKIFFTKIDVYRKELAEKRSAFKEIEETEAKVQSLIEDCEKEKEAFTNQVFKRFQEEFQHIFAAVTSGKADVRLKKNQEKERGFTKFRNSITVMVSFSAASDMTKKWSEFSGGQKSVLAFCILMALQKCEPAPFYVLDEIDAALDPIYLERIVSLIRQESSRSQYFISSFKQEMLDFPEDICNYYLVSMEGRVSSVSRVSQSYAKETAHRIVG